MSQQISPPQITPPLDYRSSEARAGRVPPAVSRAVSAILGPAIGLLVVVGIFGIWKPEKFLSQGNLINVLTSNYHYAVAAVGMTFVIITAGIDLSVGSTMALSCAVTALVIRGVKLPAYDTATGLAVGAFVGAFLSLCIGARRLESGRSVYGVVPLMLALFVAGILGGWLLWYLLAETLIELPNVLPGFSIVKTLVVAIGEGLLIATLILVRANNVARRPVARAVLMGTGVALAIGLCSYFLAGRQFVWLVPVFAILVGIAVGSLAGFINGSLITSLNLPPFIVTLATLEAFRGLVLFIADGSTVTPDEGWSSTAKRMMGELRWLHFDEVWGVPINVVLTLAVILIGVPVLHFSILGRYAYAIGSNERTARLCGVNVERYKTLCYIIAGATAGLAGVMMTAKFKGGQPSEFAGAELTIIAAVVIGGTSLFGGEGTIIGTMLGILMLGLLYSGCVIADISSFVQRIFIGGTIVLAAALDRFRHMRR